MSEIVMLKQEISTQDHVYGSMDASVNVVIYGDLQDLHSFQAYEILHELKNRLGKHVSFVFRHFPQKSRHPYAQLAAEAVEAAAAQGKYKEMLGLLKKHQGTPTEDVLIQYATSLELDLERFRSELENHTYKWRVDQDYHSGLASGVQGTPTFFINGIRYDGPWEIEALMDEIEKPLGIKMRDVFQRFASMQAAGGILLVIATIIALLLANSPWAEQYFHFWETPITINMGGFTLSEHLREWVNDGLMALFFLVVGLEIKRAVTVGELASFRRAALPIAAALGGMVVPVLIYSIINAGTEFGDGWAIPMATDIAFALGILTMLGDRVPLPLKLFFAAMAIADDLGAVVVLGIFYSDQIVWAALIAAGLLIAALVGLNIAGVRRPSPYAVLGVILWLTVLQSGLHPTIAGFALALTIPSRVQRKRQAFVAQATSILDTADASNGVDQEEDEAMLRRQQTAAQTLELIASNLQAPAQRFEHSVSPWTTFVILPLFAFANTGMAFNGDLMGNFSSPLSTGIILGLVLGKAVGVSLFSWLAVRIGIAEKSLRISWKQLIAASPLAGVGFTMSIFISGSAFGNSPLLDSAKISVLAASLFAMIIGVASILYISNSSGEMARTTEKTLDLELTPGSTM